MKNKFSVRLKELLDDNKLSQKDFAKRIGVSTSIVSDWVRGAKQPTAENIYLTAEFFGVCADYLIGRKDWY